MTTLLLTRQIALMLLDSGVADKIDLRCKDFPCISYEPDDEWLDKEGMTLEEWEEYESECWTGLQTGDEEDIRECIEEGLNHYYTEFAIWT